MQDQGKTNEQLMAELEALRQRVARIEAGESAHLEAGGRTRYLDDLLRWTETVNELISREMELEEERRRIDKALEKAHARLERQVEKRIAPRVPTREEAWAEADVRRPGQQASRELVDLWQTAFSSGPDLLALKNKDLVYQAANLSFCRFLGLEQEKVVGRTDFDLFSQSEAEPR